MRIPITAAVAIGALGCGGEATSSSSNPPSDKAVLISAAAKSQHQQETAFAQSGNRIVAVWIGTLSDGFLTTIEYAISDNAGVTWGAPAQIPIPSPSLALSDPGVVTDDAGNFTLVALGDGPHMGVYVFRLAAGAQLFGAPVTVDSITAVANHFDKTLIARVGSGYLVTYSASARRRPASPPPASTARPGSATRSPRISRC